MDEEITGDPPLNSEQKTKVKSLSSRELETIDETLFENTASVWKKVSYVVVSTMLNLEDRIQGIPDVFYAQRVKELVENGRLVSQGNLNRMRYSEVKRPDKII